VESLLWQSHNLTIGNYIL